jgi:hypothetical protein
MIEIRLSKDAIERIVDAAMNIGRRLLTSLATPSTPSLNGARLVRRHCSIDFIQAFRKLNVDGRRGRAAWDLVYNHAEELPPILSDDSGYGYSTVQLPRGENTK